MKPIFSIVIPLFNKEKEIQQTLESVLKQTFHDFEVIIINDGSTDKSEQIVNSFTDERILLISTDNKGVSQARNFGINYANGEIIAFIDADDYWFPNHLEKLFELHQKFPETGLLATNYEFYFSEHNIIRPTFDGIPAENWSGIVKDFFKSSMTYRLAWTSAVAVPKAILDKIGCFDETITLGAGEDTDLWIRIAVDYPVAFSTEISARYNMTAQNKIVNPSLKKFLDLYRVVYALKHKLAGDEKNFAYYYSAIAMENCPLKSRILLKLPTFILKKLFVFGRLLNSNKMYFNFYTRLFKS